MSRIHFSFLMALIMASGPFAIDAYLPGMPSMAEYLNVGVDSVAATVSFYVFGMALGQLIGGPFADRFDKRSIIIGGLVLYAISSIIIALASNIHIIQISRIFQAVGGGFAGVCIAPLVRARVKGNEAAKLFGLIALIMVLAPAVAPSIGALILLTGKWQNIFYFTAGYALFVAFMVATSLDKSPVSQIRQSLSPLSRYRAVLSNVTAVRYLFVQACGFSVMMVFVANSSLIYQGHFGLSEQVFGLMFAANTLMNIVANRLNSRLLSSVPSHTLLRAGILIQGAFVVALVLFTFFDSPVHIYSIGIIGAVGMLGAIMPNSNALFISQYKENTGSASALLGSTQFLFAAAMSGLTTQLYNETLWPIIIVMACLVVLSNILLPKPTADDSELSE